MKLLLTYLTAIILLSSCSMVKSVLQPKQTVVLQAPSTEAVEVKPENKRVKIGGSSTVNYPSAIQTKDISGYNSQLELFSLQQFKYAIRLDVPVETLQNKTLYALIDEWWGTPYRLGGSTHNGIDCSAFVQTMMFGVFSIQLPRTAREQKQHAAWIPTSDLREGDLVFFNTRGSVSHVGVYLHNNKFVHASTSGGVMISDLKETYWSRKFLGAGRVISTPPLP